MINCRPKLFFSSSRDWNRRVQGKTFCSMSRNNCKTSFFRTLSNNFWQMLSYITSQYQEKIFQPFFAWKENKKIVVFFWHWAKGLSNFVLSDSQLPKRAFSANFYRNFEVFRAFWHIAKNHFVFWFHYDSRRA